MLEIIVVVRFAHRRELHHLRHSFLELVGVTVHGRKRSIAGFNEFLVLVRRKIDIERHQALSVEWINRARGCDRELGVEFYRVLQIR